LVWVDDETVLSFGEGGWAQGVGVLPKCGSGDLCLTCSLVSGVYAHKEVLAP
jgi:hypothetical protein